MFAKRGKTESELLVTFYEPENVLVCDGGKKRKREREKGVAIRMYGR